MLPLLTFAVKPPELKEKSNYEQTSTKKTLLGVPRAQGVLTNVSVPAGVINISRYPPLKPDRWHELRDTGLCILSLLSFRKGRKKRKKLQRKEKKSWKKTTVCF